MRPGGGEERAELLDGPDLDGLGGASRGRFDRAAGLAASNCSTSTASASALRSVRWMWETVVADKARPSRPPCSARSR